MTDLGTLIGNLEERLYWPQIEIQVNEDRYFVEAFCSVYDTNLMDIKLSTDVNPEALYVFGDKLGGYTIHGVKTSLQEKHVQWGF